MRRTLIVTALAALIVGCDEHVLDPVGEVVVCLIAQCPAPRDGGGGNGGGGTGPPAPVGNVDALGTNLGPALGVPPQDQLWSDASDFFVTSFGESGYLSVVRVGGDSWGVVGSSGALWSQLSGDGSTLYFTDAQCALRRARINSNEWERGLVLHASAGCEFTMSRDGRYVTTDREILDLSDSSRRPISLEGTPRTVSQSGAFVAFVSLDNQVPGSLRRRVRAVRTLNVADGSVREVWTSDSTALVQRRYLGMRWSDDALQVLAVVDEFLADETRESTLRVFDGASGEERIVGRSPLNVLSVDAASWSANGEAVALWGPDVIGANGIITRSLHVVATDGSNRPALVVTPFFRPPVQLAISPDAKLLAVAYNSYGYLKVLR